MISPALSTHLTSAIAPYAAAGRAPVGEASPEARHTPFQPVEQLPPAARQDPRTSTGERAAEAETRTAADANPVYSRPRRQRMDGETARQSDSPSQQSSQPLSQSESETDSARRQQEALEQQQIQELAARDREVRAHEMAHSAAGGQLAGAPTYQYQRGPDGVSYAVSGEVAISLGEVRGDPEATLRNARIVQQAALAPAEPSPQDRQVAADAARLQQQALAEIAVQAQEERDEADAQRVAAREERESLSEQRPGAEPETGQQVIGQQRTERENTEPESRRQADDEDRMQQVIRSNVDFNQRLIDIGVRQPLAAVGELFSQRV